jgi:hypothetical protein
MAIIGDISKWEVENQEEVVFPALKVCIRVLNLD